MAEKSILTDNLEQCMMCGSRTWIEEHHVFGGADRKKSTKYKLLAPLCHYCHNEPPHGVHHNAKNRLKLEQAGQRAFNSHYPELDFMKIFGRNYL